MRLSTRGVAAALLVALVAGVCVRLGVWQLDRLEQRRARNAALSGALSLPPLALEGDTLARLLREPDAYLYRRVRVAGSYLPGADVVLRGRASRGSPGVHVVTPLRLPGGPYAVLVNRGWAPSPDAVTLDPRPLAEPGPRVVEGVLLAVPRTAEGGVAREIEVAGRPVLTLQRVDLAALQPRVPHPLLPLLLQQLPDPAAPAAPLVRVPLPEMGEGSHLSYAVQWFSFAAIAVIGFLALALRRR